MRILALLAWLLVPLPVLAYHMGPGQHHLATDQVTSHLTAADQAALDKDWLLAIGEYDAALQLLPSELTEEGQWIRLERAKAQMNASQLPEAHADLRDLVDELREDDRRNRELYREARAAYANAQYYVTWLMRLEGEPRDIWEPEIEGARQTLAALAEEAEEAGEATELIRYQEDLESSIRLARMDISDLQALPLPSQCKGCKSCDCQCRKPGNRPSQSSNTGKGAGLGPALDGSGS